jgi:hypothetical protein
VIDPDGVEWLPVAEAAARINVKPSLIYVWLHRGMHSHKIAGRAYVPMPAILDAEHAWRTRNGGHPRQRLAQPNP